MFQLHPRLEQDTVLVGKFDLCQVLLSKDANYPWCILVPEREGLSELYQLAAEDRNQFIAESNRLSKVMEAVFKPEKLNVAALGNVVRQLHIHHVARYTSDAAWPQPIWGKVAHIDYQAEALNERLQKLQIALSGSGFTVA